MKLEFYAQVHDVRSLAKDKSYKWVLLSGEDSKIEAIKGFSLGNEDINCKITIEVLENEEYGGKSA